MKTKIRALVAALAVGTITFTAHAGIVTQWTATDSATFIAATGATLNPTVLSWGTPATSAGQSSLTINGSTPNQTVNTYIGGGLPPPAFIAPGSSLTHVNNPIFAPSLTAATIRDTLTLTALAPPGIGPGLLPPILFDIAFKETTNANCQFPSTSVCDDIFVLLGGFFNQTFTYDTDGSGGDAPVTYFVNIFPTSGGVLSTLSNASCFEAGQPNGCFGFQTIEQGSTTLAFGFTISTEPLSVPEPGTLALVGLALLGISKSRRMARVR